MCLALGYIVVNMCVLRDKACNSIMSYREDYDEKEAGLPEEVLDEVLGGSDEDDDDKIAGLPEEEEKEWE